MARINDNYLKLKAGYLFPEISRRVQEFSTNNPEKDIIKMGIGDVTVPLCESVINEFHNAVDEMAELDTFKGYGPEQGYEFLRKLICENEYNNVSEEISPDEIFISDGSKCDTGNIQEIFGDENKIAICDPVYPVYVDTTVMAGKTGECMDNGYYDGIEYLPCTDDNGFSPQLPKIGVDIIYLCSPNNPTGTTLSKEDLAKWVAFANENDSIILFDAAYEGFITEDGVPHSIYEIEGAKEVAIEFRSFSKKAGFTGTRCAYTVVPKNLKAKDAKGKLQSVHALWLRRQCTKFNGVSYPVQKAAAAIYTEQGKKEVKKIVDFYMENASIIKKSLAEKGYEVYGGVNAPYVWLKTKDNKKSWDFFDELLNKCGIVGTPGSGFGPSGEGYFRFSAFASRENVLEAMNRISNL